MPTTTVQKQQKGDQSQYMVTIPKNLAESMQLGGEKVEWEIESKNALVIRRVK